MSTHIIISDHAFLRWRERRNLSYKISISKLARQAYEKGTEAGDFAGTAFESWLNYTASKFRAGNQKLKVYKNYIFIYGRVEKDEVLITVIEIPEKFYWVKDYRIMRES